MTLSSAGKSAVSALSGFGGTGTDADTIDVSAGLLRDGAGNLSSATSTATSAVELLDDTAPVLGEINIFGEFTSTQLTGRVAGDAFISGDTLTFTATITEATDLQDNENMAVTLTLTNNKVLTLVRPDGADGSDKAFSADYIITEGDTDDDDLGVKSYTIDNVADISGNAADASVALGAITKTFGGMVKDAADSTGATGLTILVDANPPTAKILGTEANPHTYDAATGELVLQGESLRTLLTSGDDVKNIVDWSELTWNVDGVGSTTMAFAIEDVDTAVVDTEGETLTVTLTANGKTALHGLGGFGGVEATGGVADVINVGGGFMRDAAGNVSSEVSTTASTVSISDIVAPVLSSLTVVSQEVRDPQAGPAPEALGIGTDSGYTFDATNVSAWGTANVGVATHFVAQSTWDDPLVKAGITETLTVLQYEFGYAVLEALRTGEAPEVTNGDTSVIFTSSELGLKVNIAVTGGMTVTGTAPEEIVSGDVTGITVTNVAGDVTYLTGTSLAGLNLEDDISFVLEAPSSVVVGPTDDATTTAVDETIIKFQAEFTDANSELADDAQMVLTLNNGASVTMTKSSVVGEELFMVGELDVVSGQNMDTLFDGGYDLLEVDNIDVSDVRDDAGNEAASDALLDAVNLKPLTVDTIAPTLQQAVLNTTSNEMTFVFDEILSDASITSLITAIDAVTELSGSAASGATNTKITATFTQGVEAAPSNGDVMDFDVDFDDLAGNTTEITGFEIITIT